MAAIVEQAKEFIAHVLEENNKLDFFKIEYLSIGKDGKIRISPYTHYLEEARVGIIFCYYNYLVQTAYDDSCFVQFVDDEGFSGNHYMKNGWTIGVNQPHTSFFRTYDRRECTISNGEISVDVILPVYGISERMKLLWPYFLKAQECQTLKELWLLKDCFEKDINITQLSESSLREEYSRMILEKQIMAYKAVLDKIEKLVNG